MSALTALVLAGTRPGGDPLAQALNLSHKALIGIGGRTMLERVVAALDAVPQIDRIVVAIDRPELLAPLPGLQAALASGRVATMPTAAGPSATVARALRELGTPLLVTTADHALLQSSWLQHFLDAAPATLDVAVGIARKEAVLIAVPDTQRTYLRFADGEYSGCNLFLLRTPRAAGVMALWQTLEAERKQPLKMLRRIGWTQALRYRLGWLRSDQALARLGALSGGARLGFVEMIDGRAAVDVDKPADLELVRRLLP